MIKQIKKSIVNHLLSQNDWMKSTLINHKNKVISFNISDIDIVFIIQEDGQLCNINEYEKFDCVIKLTINDLINQLSDVKKANISIEGDMELAQEVTQVLKKIEWDIEEDLSKLIGDIPAIHTTRILKNIIKTSKKNVNSLTDSLIEFWEEENQILAKKKDVEVFQSEVDQIVEDTERLEARIKQIIKEKI